MKVKSESEIAQSCPTLSDPMACSPPGSSVHGIFQARVLEWGAIAFSGLRVSLLRALVPALMGELKISRAAQPKKKKKLVKLAEFKHEVVMARWRAREAEVATPSSQLLSMELTMWY